MPKEKIKRDYTLTVRFNATLNPLRSLVATLLINIANYLLGGEVKIKKLKNRKRKP